MASTRDGWIELEIPWHETRIKNCPICGKLITRRAWRFVQEDRELVVCSPPCEELYETYWERRYGALSATERSGR